VFSRPTGNFRVSLIKFLLAGDGVEGAEASSIWAIINLHIFLIALLIHLWPPQLGQATLLDLILISIS
jgi:hypothetical protein